MIPFAFVCVYAAAFLFFAAQNWGPYFNTIVTGSQAFLFAMSVVAVYYQPSVVLLFSIFFFTELLLGDHSANCASIGRVKEGRVLAQREWKSRIERSGRYW